MKYTSGPWSVGQRNAGGAIEISADDYYVADVIGGLVERQEANARLISSAPDLLEALRDMVDWLDDGNRQLSDACADDVLKARAAIARATGETP